MAIVFIGTRYLLGKQNASAAAFSFADKADTFAPSALCGAQMTAIRSVSEQEALTK